MSDTNTPSLLDAKAYIDAIDFTNVIDRIVTTKKWKKEDVLKIETLYKNFLFLYKKYPDKTFPPSEEIDEFWHNHILNTEQYIKDCDHIFGKYLHHDPNIVVDGKRANNADMQKQFEVTQALYCKEFGTYIYDVRPHFFKQLATFFKLLLQKNKSNSHIIT